MVRPQHFEVKQFKSSVVQPKPPQRVAASEAFVGFTMLFVKVGIEDDDNAKKNNQN